MRRSRRLTAFGVGIAVVLAGTGPAFADYWARPASNPGGPVELCYVPQGLDATASAAAQAAIATWGSVTTGLRTTYGTCDQGANVIPLMLGQLDRPNNELGRTEWKGSPVIRSAQITFDPVSIDSWVRELSAQSAQSYGSVLASVWRGVFCHEVGHTLGLDHTTKTDSCMQTNTNRPFLFPGQDDRQTLFTYYGGTPITPSIMNIPGVAAVNRAPVNATSTMSQSSIARGIAAAQNTLVAQRGIDNTADAQQLGQWRAQLQVGNTGATAQKW